MSLSADRAAIAAAISTIEGITCTTEAPRVVGVGAAWPLLAEITRDPWPVARWVVRVVLAPNASALLEQLDALGEVMWSAVQTVMSVSSMVPVTVATSAGDLFAVEIHGLREV